MENKILYFVKFLIFSIAFVAVSVLLMVISSFMGNSDKEVLLHTSSYNDKIYVIIDAGHGGEDGGAVSDSGIVEKDLNLDIALRLDKFITLSDNISVLVRDTDRLMYEPGQESHKKASDISNRIKLAEGYDNAIFISIHQNKFPIKKYSGLQVYYSKNDTRSETFGKLIQSNTKKLLQNDNNRQAKKADKNIRLLDSITHPAVLVECGFLSNNAEAELLNTEEYRSKLAYILFCSVVEYLEQIKGGHQIEK